MNLRQLQHFLVLGELLNFRKAAQKLNIVQPALTASIRRLEEEIGADLFERSTRNVCLTPAGQAALQEFQTALIHIERAKQRALATIAGEAGQISVGFVGSASFALLPAGVRTFRTIYPEVQLSLFESTGTRIINLIKSGEIDVGLIRTPVQYSKGMQLVPLQSQQLVAVVPLESPWGSQNTSKSNSLSKLADAPFINFTQKKSPMLHAAVINACRESGFVPNIVQEAIQVQTIVTLVESGLGVGLVPSVSSSHKPANARFLKISKPTQSCETGLALAFNPETITPAGRNFVDTLTSIANAERSARKRPFI